jgi:hypothetical protein
MMCKSLLIFFNFQKFHQQEAARLQLEQEQQLAQALLHSFLSNRTHLYSINYLKIKSLFNKFRLP